MHSTMITTACFLVVVPDYATVVGSLPIGDFSDATAWVQSLYSACPAGSSGPYPSCIYGTSSYVDDASDTRDLWENNFDTQYFDDQCAPFGTTAISILYFGRRDARCN